MKTIIFTVVLASTSISMASATCPVQAETLASCKSTPQNGDQEIAAGVFDSIAVCKQDSTTSLVLEKNGASESAPAKVDDRVGASTYTIDTGDVDFALTIVVAPRAKTLPAKLKINFKAAKLEATSTYTCVK